jgi:hypothetical protein
MSFLYPAFLTALATIAIPIIIHLFHFRRFKKVYFTNVRFLKEVKQETSSRQKIRNLLVLTMRILAIAMLVLAFAQPFLPKSDQVKQGMQAISLFIDNSFSMNARAQEAPLLELAKKRAREIVQAYPETDRFQILTNDLEGQDQRLISKEEALNRIEEIRSSPLSQELSKVALRQAQCLATGKAEHKTAFWLTDFQRSVTDLSKVKDTTVQYQLIPLRAVQERNVSIDSAWFDSPVQILNQPANLFVKISNQSDVESEEIRLSLQHDGQVKPAGSLQIPARSSRIDTVSFTILHPGWHQVKLSVTDFPVQFDDDYYASFYVAERIQVLSINEGNSNKYLNKVFAGAPYFTLEQMEARALDYSRLGNYQLIVLNELPVISSGLVQELKTFAQNGGHILMFPSRNAELNSYNSLLSAFEGGTMGEFDNTARQASQINTEEFVFRDVFLNKNEQLRLPSTQGNFPLSPGKGEVILGCRDGSAMLNKYSSGEGALYCSAAPLQDEWNDLVRNAEIFVPLLFKTAISGSKSRQIAYTIGKEEVLEARHKVVAGGETIYKLKKSGTGDQEFIPEQRILGSKVLLTPGKSIQESGWYRLGLQADSLVAEYAFNLDRKESDLSYYSDAELETQLQPNLQLLSETAEANFTQVVGEQNQGVVLWRWFLVFALLFLALETLFLRLWKV